MIKFRYIGSIGLAVAAAGAIATVGIAQDPDTATADAKPLAAWFSVSRDGAIPSASAIQRLSAATGATEGPGEPAASTARVAFNAPNGRQILVRGKDNIACYDIPEIGGGCAVSPLANGPTSPPVLVGGVGQSEPVKRSWFSALVGDGVKALDVDVEYHNTITLPVRNNVVLAEIPGRALSWSWTDPDGTTHTEGPDLKEAVPAK